MKNLLFVLVISQVIWAQGGSKDEVKPEAGEHHEFVIANFHSESGAILPVARISYGSYGHLNAARDNALLLPSHYVADYHGYEWLIGPGGARNCGAGRREARNDF